MLFVCWKKEDVVCSLFLLDSVVHLHEGTRVIGRSCLSDAVVTSFVFHDNEDLIFAVLEITIHLTQIHRTLNCSIQQDSVLNGAARPDTTSTA